jgi:general transcriptional corepressor TUP1
VRLWDVVEGKPVYTLAIEDGVTTVAMSPDSHYVAAGSLDKSVRVWDTTTSYLVERLESPDGHKDSVYSVAFAPNGRELVSGSLDKTIKMWELSASKGGKCVQTFEGHKVRHDLRIPQPPFLGRTSVGTLIMGFATGFRAQCLFNP